MRKPLTCLSHPPTRRWWREDFDKATASFRDALRYDQRHYNAW